MSAEHSDTAHEVMMLPTHISGAKWVPGRRASALGLKSQAFSAGVPPPEDR